MLVKWILILKIEPLINYEAFATIAFLILMDFVFYKLFLKRLSEIRHEGSRPKCFSNRNHRILYDDQSFLLSS